MQHVIFEFPGDTYINIKHKRQHLLHSKTYKYCSTLQNNRAQCGTIKTLHLVKTKYKQLIYPHQSHPHISYMTVYDTKLNW